MLIEMFNEKEISEQIKYFYDDIVNIFFKTEYHSDNSNYVGRYKLTKKIIEDLNPDTDYDYLLFTGEGNKLQDELVIKYHNKYILKDIENLIEEFDNEDIYIKKEAIYTDDINNISWDKISQNSIDDKIKPDLIDFRNQNLKINITSLVACCHIYGITKLTDFLKNKEKIYCDKNLIPISSTIKYFSKYDLSKFWEIKDDKKVILSNSDKKDKEIIKEDKNNEDFLGQKSEEKIEDILKNLKDNDVLNKILEYINKDKNKENNSKKNNEEEIFKDYTEKKIVKRNSNVDDRLKEKYESNEYSNDPINYVEDTTNRKVSKDNKEDIKNILNEYENETKDKKNIGNVIKQKNFNKLRSIEKSKESINIEEIILMILENEENNPLDKLENSLKKYSCKYIKESFSDRAISLAKNIFLSKVSDFINEKLGDNNVELNIDLSEYNYLEFGLKDIDDIKVNPNKEILNTLKIRNLVKQSYALDKNGIRIYPRCRRLFDNILITYIKKRIKFSSKYFDGVNFKKVNIVRNYILFLDELREGLQEKDYIFFEKIGSKLNITRLIYTLLKNKTNDREISLSKINILLNNKNYDNYVLEGNKNEDKNLILSIYPTLDSIRNFFKLKKMENISSFYENFYKNNNSNIKVTNSNISTSATLKCSLGEGISAFITKNSNSFVENKVLATVVDTNILPFQFCKVCKICKPNLVGKWSSNSNLNIKGNKTLLKDSKIFCSFGGLITIDNENSSLNKSDISYPKDNKEEKIYNNPYKNMSDASSLLSKTILSPLSIIKFISSISNPILFNNMLNEYIENMRKNIEKELKPNFDDANIDNKYNLALYEHKEKKLYNLDMLSDTIKDYFLSYINQSDKNSLGYFLFKKYGTNLDSDKLLNDLKSNSKNINKNYLENEKINKNTLPWIKTLFEEFNKYKSQKESNNSLNNRIIQYHKIGGGIDANHKVAWCSSFVNWNLIKSGVSNVQEASSLNMIKYLKKIDKPIKGSILILRKYDKFNNPTEQGHITFIMGLSNNNTKYYCLGGNQNNEIKYSKYNIKGQTKVGGGFLKVVGIYWPKDFPLNTENGEEV